MNIKQFRYGDTNLAYLVWSGKEAAVIDGGAVEEILDFAADEGLEIKYVTNTHEHYDHVPGNSGLLSRTAAEHVSPLKMCDMKVLGLGSEQLEAFPTPGHSEDSIVFFFKDGPNDNLVTGDTLFNGTVGNCYTKNYELYFDSLLKVLRFPDDTAVYAGHDIFDYATGVIEQIDPDNLVLSEYKALYSKEALVTTLKMEKTVNPFIRFNDPSLDKYRSGLNLPTDTPYERWRAMMSVH